jgi:probable F420-dependent oxidoreductase
VAGDNGVSPMKVDVALAMGGPLGAGVRAAELAELGVDGLFTFENAHDVFFPLVQAAATTDGVDLMTNVAMALPRSPLHLAYAANDLQLLSGGRFRLGVGSQIRPHIERRYGARWERPVAQMRESVLATKAILNHFAGEGPFDFKGEWTTHTLMTPNFNPGPNPFGPPPVLVGALGPQMTAMAAEVADGVLIMPFNSRRHLLQRTLPAIERGLARSGRDRGDIEIVAEIICAVGRTAEEINAALEGVRLLVAFYASTPSYAPVLEAEGRPDLQPEMNQLSKQGDWQTMATRIDDDLLGSVAAVGTPEQVAGQIVDRIGDMADRVCLYFPSPAITDRTIAELAANIARPTSSTPR